MTSEIRPAQLDDAEKLGDICYRAFDDVSRRHGFESDFDSPAMAQMILSGLIRDEHCHSVTALENGEPVGSNFIETPDDVGAIGPITIDPALQGHGIGRALMEDVLSHARASLALYKLPMRIHIVDRIAKTASGKIARGERN